MPVSILIERSRLGKVFFELRGEHLSLSGQRMLFPVRAEVDLRDVSPDFDVQLTRYYKHIFGFGGVGLVVLGVAVGMLTQTWVPPEALHPFVLEIGGFGAGLLGIGLYWIPPVTVVRFRTYDGETAFDLVREPGHTREVDAYLGEITAAIARARGAQ